MANRVPLVLGAAGLPQALQAGDTITVATTFTDIESLTNGEASTALTIGMPVYASAAGTVKRAQANAISTAEVVGLCYDVSITAAASGNVATSGRLSATTAQWDAVTGGSGGLTFNTNYFLDPTTPGKLTATPPTTPGQVNTLVGVGMSATDMRLILNLPILL